MLGEKVGRRTLPSGRELRGGTLAAGIEENVDVIVHDNCGKDPGAEFVRTPDHLQHTGSFRRVQQHLGPIKSPGDVAAFAGMLEMRQVTAYRLNAHFTRLR